MIASMQSFSEMIADLNLFCPLRTNLQSFREMIADDAQSFFLSAPFKLGVKTDTNVKVSSKNRS